MTIALALLSRLWPYLLGAAVLIGGWVYADRVCWSSACRSAKAELVELRAEKAAAVERATAMTMLWAKAIDNVEVRYVEVERKRVDAFADIRARSVRLDGGGVVLRVPDSAASLLGDIARAANDPAAPQVDQGATAPVPESARDTTLAEWVAFATDAAEAYAECRAKWSGAVAAYEAISPGGYGVPPKE